MWRLILLTSIIVVFSGSGYPAAASPFMGDGNVPRNQTEHGWVKKAGLDCYTHQNGVYSGGVHIDKPLHWSHNLTLSECKAACVKKDECEAVSRKSSSRIPPPSIRDTCILEKNVDISACIEFSGHRDIYIRPVPAQQEESTTNGDEDAQQEELYSLAELIKNFRDDVMKMELEADSKDTEQMYTEIAGDIFTQLKEETTEGVHLN